jgi:hypothetical protein
VWKRVGGGKYAEDIYVSAHVDDYLIACKSKDIMTAFKKEILTRFIGTDEGEVTEYLGCELIRDRSAKTATIVQKGYAERVLKTFGMWHCKPCALRWMLTVDYLRQIALRLWIQPFITVIAVLLLDACSIW